MTLIHEALLSTATADGGTHLAPLGFRREGEFVVLAPFHPSRTLEALRATGRAALNHTDDLRIYAGCLTGRRDWPLVPCRHIPCGRLAAALGHEELEVARIEDDAQRPRFLCRSLGAFSHAPHPGFNRAQAAILEACILVSRLNMLSADKVDREMDYLAIAVAKTAGPRELEAWNWLRERVAAHRAAGEPAVTTWLASVRNGDEARQVLAAGVGLVDCKDPSAGALGALDPISVKQVLDAVAGRVAVSATVGDFPDMDPGAVAQAVTAMAARGVDYVKVGLFPGPALDTCLAALAGPARQCRLVAVLFADRQPDFSLLPRLARLGFAGAMLDTVGKGGGSLTCHQTLARLDRFVREARALDLLSGLAGSLTVAEIPRLLPLGPDYLGFRGALCRAGQRGAALDGEALAAVAGAMQAGRVRATLDLPQQALSP